MTAPVADRRLEMRGTLATFYGKLDEAAEAERKAQEAVRLRALARIARRAMLTGQDGRLTVTEARIMATLQAAYPRWLTPAELIGIVHCWDGQSPNDANLCRRHVFSIRRKLGYNAIHSRRNRGYLQGVIA